MSDTMRAPPPPSQAPTSTTTATNSTNLSTPALDFTANPPTNLPSPPFIHVEGVPNFRELGGYACPGPFESPSHNPPSPSTSTLRRNYLFRSATLAQITPTGTDTLTTKLNVHTLYDLRSEPEIATALRTNGPDALTIPHVTRHFVPVYRDENYSPVALARKYAMYTAPDADPSHGYSTGFVQAYRDIAQHAGPAYRRILEHVRDRPDEPLLFHCTAGKDRTGVLAAMLLRLCGVADEVVAWEYGLTEMGLGVWRAAIVERMMKGGGGGFNNAATAAAGGAEGGNMDEGEGKEREERKGMSREQAERIVGSRAKNMTIFLTEVLDGEFGGVRKYFKDYCGLTEEDLDRIRANLVVEGEEPVSPPVGWRASESGIESEAESKGIRMALAGDGDMGREEKIMAG